MSSDSRSEKREFFRVDFRYPVKFRQVRESKDQVRLATSSNISTSGILFRTRVLHLLSSIIWIDMDLRTLKICQEIEARALVHEEGLVGRVVRVEEDTEESQLYDVGVCFLRKNEADLLRHLNGAS